MTPIFRCKQRSLGRPRPGTDVDVQVRLTLPSGKVEWRNLTTITSSEAEGGWEPAKRLAIMLQAAWDYYYQGRR